MSQKRYHQEFKQTVIEAYHLGTPVRQLSGESSYHLPPQNQLANASPPTV